VQLDHYECRHLLAVGCSYFHLDGVYFDVFDYYFGRITKKKYFQEYWAGIADGIGGIGGIGDVVDDVDGELGELGDLCDLRDLRDLRDDNPDLVDYQWKLHSKSN
jgi:hypothetical protein